MHIAITICILLKFVLTERWLKITPGGLYENKNIYRRQRRNYRPQNT